MNAMKVAAQMSCPLCGARQVRLSDECWLCGIARGEDGLLGSHARVKRFSFSLRSMFSATSFVACCCGLIAMLSGFGVFLSLLLVGVALRTLLVVKRRREKGIATNRGERLNLFVRSLVRTVFTLCVACIALIEIPLVGVILFFVLLSSVGSASAHLFLSAMVSIVLALLATLVIGIERRFRRDTSRK